METIGSLSPLPQRVTEHATSMNRKWGIMIRGSKPSYSNVRKIILDKFIRNI